MSEDFQSSRFNQTRPVSEDQERFELCEEQAGAWFASATVTQTAIWHQALSDLRGLSAPRYDRARDAANAEFHRTTAAARELCEETVRELMRDGEISETLSYRWDELNVAGAMLEAAE